jgi:hypothetical protein
MITTENFKTLKQISISVNPSKSGVRILEEFKNTNKLQKAEIQRLTGFSNFNNFYNAGKSGVASPKVVVALAHVLNISPQYLTGEIDDKGICDAAEIAEIFALYGSVKKSKKAKSTKSAAKKVAKPAGTKTQDSSSAPAKAAKTAKSADKEGQPAKVESVVVKTPEVKSAGIAKIAAVEPPVALAVPVATVSAIDDDALFVLFEALSIRAKYSGNAAATFEQIKGLLLQG